MKFRFVRLASDLGKYKQLAERYVSLSGRFKEESSFAWQWPRDYKPVASQSSFEIETLSHEVAGIDYDVDSAWLAMRKTHAEQCLEFVRSHNEQMIAWISDKLSDDRIREAVTAEVASDITVQDFYNLEEVAALIHLPMHRLV